MYHALEGLQEVVDGDLDTEEAARIEAHLAVAKQSDRSEIVSLADTVSKYLQQESQQILEVKISLWKRIVV
jgi:anti-sigma factor RsiW